MIRVIQVGFGGVGKRRAALIAESAKATLVGIVEPMPRQDDWPDVPVFGSLPEALDATDATAVILSTPNGDHAPDGLLALARGLHVLIEKPLCTTVEEADRLTSAADRGGGVLKLGANHQYFPSVLGLLDRLEGAPDSVTIGIGHNRHTALPEWFRSARRGGGGTLIDNGSHAVMLIRSLWALSGDDVAQVRCDIERLGEVDVTANCELKSDQGRTARFKTSWVDDRPYRFDVTVADGDRTWTIANPGSLSLNGAEQPLVEAPSWGLDLDEWLGAIETRTAPRYDGAEGRRNMVVLRAAYESGGDWVSAA